jgi:hypothetical protein
MAMQRSHLVSGGFAGAALLFAVACSEPHGGPTTPGATQSATQLSAPPQPELSRSRPDRPELVRCPTNVTRSTTGLIGILGGTLSLGGTVVTIPAGALLAPKTFTLTIPKSKFMEIDVTAKGTNGFIFQLPVAIALDYSRCSRQSTDQEPLSVWHINTKSKKLLQNMNGVDNKVTRTITFTTGHLSGYAIAN